MRNRSMEDEEYVQYCTWDFAESCLHLELFFGFTCNRICFCNCLCLSKHDDADVDDDDDDEEEEAVEEEEEVEDDEAE